MSIDVWIFDVGRGSCAAIRSPNNYLTLIDCGNSDSFSPIDWLAQKDWQTHNQYRLAKFIVTHPHIDHISDIEKLTNSFLPAIIHRRTDLDSQRVSSAGTDTTSIYQRYEQYFLPPQYTDDPPIIDWGENFYLKSYLLDESKVGEVSGTDSQYLNNSSLITILKYNGFNFAFSGDMETEGIASLLRNSLAFNEDIVDGFHFYVTPHHGHPSGFSTEWFNLTGPSKIFNIASERSRKPGEDEAQTQIDIRYSDDKFSLGNNRENRKMVSTRNDGHIYIQVSDDGTWSWATF